MKSHEFPEIDTTYHVLTKVSVSGVPNPRTRTQMQKYPGGFPYHTLSLDRLSLDSGEMPTPKREYEKRYKKWISKEHKRANKEAAASGGWSSGGGPPGAGGELHFQSHDVALPNLRLLTWKLMTIGASRGVSRDSGSGGGNSRGKGSSAGAGKAASNNIFAALGALGGWESDNYADLVRAYFDHLVAQMKQGQGTAWMSSCWRDIGDLVRSSMEERWR
jgi:hypothetical protein